MFRLATILSICVFALILMAGSVFAGQVWETGLKAGLSYYNLSGSNVVYTDYVAGFCMGGFVTRNLHDNFALQAEVQYIMKGGSGKPVDTVLDNKYTLTYLEFPLLAKVVFPPSTDKPDKPSYRSVGNEGFRPNFYAGPVLSVNLSATHTYKTMSSSSKTDIEGIRDLDYGLAVGGGFDTALPKGKMLFDFRYTFGLRSILEQDAGQKTRNSGATFVLGYIF